MWEVGKEEGINFGVQLRSTNINWKYKSLSSLINVKMNLNIVPVLKELIVE